MTRVSAVLRSAMMTAFSMEVCRDDVARVAFGEFIAFAIDSCCIEPGAICGRFGVTRATVSRWKSGVATPGSYMAAEVLSWISDEAAARAKAVPGFDEARVAKALEFAN